MRTEFDILWSKESKLKFDRIIRYLRKEWTEKEVNNFVGQVKNFERIVERFPKLYAESNNKVGLRRAVLSRNKRIIGRK